MSIINKHTLSEHADIYADYLPNDPVFAAKKMDGTNLRNFILGCAHLFKSAEEALSLISDEYDIRTTRYFIEEWEAFVGIPDECFDVLGTIEERREQVLMKLTSFNVLTEDDFIALALRFGKTITIDNSTLWEIKFSGNTIADFVPPFDVPYTPGSAKSEFICWFEKLVDAVTQPTFENS